MFGALQDYCSGAVQAGSAWLAQALELDSIVLPEFLHRLLKTALAIARQRGENASATFLEGVLEHLPERLDSRATIRRRVMGQLYADCAFSNLGGASASARRYRMLKAIWYDPAYVTNRGAWSIILKSFFTRRSDLGHEC